MTSRHHPVIESYVEELAVELRDLDLARQRAHDPDGIQSADTPRETARDVITSKWFIDVLRYSRAAAWIEAHSALCPDSNTDDCPKHPNPYMPHLNAVRDLQNQIDTEENK